MKSIQQLKKQAKGLYKENKKTSIAVAAICIYTTLLIRFSTDNLMILFRRQQDLIGTVSSVFVFILASAFSVGLASFSLEIVKSGKSELITFLSSFENIFKVFLLELLKTLFIFLWSLLFVFPGIIAIYNYRMAEYIMAENPDISPLEAISLSKKMMHGKKVKLLDLDLSFVGWYVLSLATLGIVGLYTLPYAHLAVTNFFIDVRSEYEEELNFRAEWDAKKSEARKQEENDMDKNDMEENNPDDKTYI
ncbi:hypothetical protein SDC9_100519 [bioreactor metagenome]|uniref:DUF975 family protein n=1 Tax=bioreactor metagenome TaxID=1076179 RepID=A0A645AKV9_9ZZZZ|nr:DUF975 family protein [Candidatus Metalachnospira sp.]